jgi:hypothetical protein
MGFPARWRKLTAGSGNLNTVVAGTTTAGTAISTANMAPGSLSCLFTVTAETNTITITPKWQVSDDNSTWYDLSGLNNAAQVALATGTAGADAAVSKVLTAPSEVSGWKYVRPAVVNGVATGAATDLYAFELHFRVYNGFSD